MDRVTLTTWARLPRFHSCVRPIRGNEAIFRPRVLPRQSARRRSQKNTQQSNLQSWRQGSRRTGPTAKSHVTRGGWVYTWLNPGGVE